MKQNITSDMMNQFKKRITSLFDYVPTRYKATQNEWKVRKFVWGFKDGQYSDYTAKLVADRINAIYGDEAKHMVFCCVPASSEEKNEIRYRNFSAKVCELTGAENAFAAVHVEGERLAIHESRIAKRVQNTEVITFDKEFFSGKRVLVFDDIITRGYSYANFACHLEKLGAVVLGGLFLAKTIIH